MVTRRREYGDGSVYQLPSGRWRATVEAGVTLEGKRRRLVVNAKTRASALKAIREKKEGLIKGTVRIGRTPTCSAFAVTWVAELERQVRPKTLAGYASSLRNWVLPVIGGVPMDKLGPEALTAIEATVREAGKSQATIRLAVVTAKAMLRAALAKGYPVPANLVSSGSLPKKGETDRAAIPEAAIAGLLDQARAVDPQWARWLAAVTLGLRQGEALGLTWDRVDLDRAVIDVSWQLQALPRVQKRGKGARKGADFRVPPDYLFRQLKGAMALVRPKSRSGVRMIPMPAELVEALREWKVAQGGSPHNLVWTAEDGAPRTARADGALWKRLQLEAGVTDGEEFYALHELRNTAATRFSRAQIDARVVQRIMGHSKVTQTREYQTVDLSQARAAVARAGEVAAASLTGERQ